MSERLVCGFVNVYECAVSMLYATAYLRKKRQTRTYAFRLSRIPVSVSGDDSMYGLEMMDMQTRARQLGYQHPYEIGGAHWAEQDIELDLVGRRTLEKEVGWSYIYPPMQVVFALKEENGGKLSSHRWFFEAFCASVEPTVCTVSVVNEEG